jgi:hypothetical protein
MPTRIIGLAIFSGGALRPAQEKNKKTHDADKKRIK